LPSFSETQNKASDQLAVAPLLNLIRQSAHRADRDRTVPNKVIDAIKQNPIMSFSASQGLGGAAASVLDIGRELEAVAAECASTGWVLWNHLGTFHLFAGLLGPANAEYLRGIVNQRAWVCFPAGASTAIRGRAGTNPAELELTGKAAFGSGARYAEYAGASFVTDDPQRPQFALVDLRDNGVAIAEDWQAMSLRASATDTVHYDGACVDVAHVVEFPFMYRVAFRDPQRGMIDHRYREDWVALSNLWLGWMAVGVVQAAFNEVADGIKDRIAIMGIKVAQRPTVHVNLGQAQANISAAADALRAACVETDERTAAQIVPTESNYLRQMGTAVSALQLCDEALRRLVRVMGGNGLREGPNFERRLRDFQAMPLHINAHQDRVREQIGRHALGLETENPF
jgi:alkylation response protein AidB-like acyl-CoA dehydrogenase